MADGCDTFSRFFQENIDTLLVNLHRTTGVDQEPGDTPCFTVSVECSSQLQPPKYLILLALRVKHTHSIHYLLNN